jgi:hypothetical protein
VRRYIIGNNNHNTIRTTGDWPLRLEATVVWSILKNGGISDLRLLGNVGQLDLIAALKCARRGDPNHGGLPRWEKYSTGQRATMIFDARKTALIKNPAEQELVLLAPFAEIFPN